MISIRRDPANEEHILWNLSNPLYGYDEAMVTIREVKQVDAKLVEAYEKLTHDTIDFINRIILGLYNLKKTYDDYNQLVCKIDSIILILIDFKDKISVKKGPRIIFRRRDSF